MKVLNRSVDYRRSLEKGSFSLTDQASVKAFLRSASISLHFDVRVNQNKLPIYYISRTRSDYWREYDLVVEDVYRSSEYPFSDERFVPLMTFGKENYFLRLSQFRQKLESGIKGPCVSKINKVDCLLHDLGRNIFQAIWHEDQRIGFLISKSLGMKHFSKAVELLYLCLGGELCDIRNIVNEETLGFFSDVYPHPPLEMFLSSLVSMKGNELSLIPGKAEKQYIRLMKEFRRFLSCEILWGSMSQLVPLWKVLFANINRMEKVGELLLLKSAMAKPIERLESCAREIIHDLTLKFQ